MSNERAKAPLAVPPSVATSQRLKATISDQAVTPSDVTLALTSEGIKLSYPINPRAWVEHSIEGLGILPPAVQEAFLAQLIVRDPATRAHFSQQASERSDVVKMMVAGDHAWMRTGEWLELGAWSFIASMAWEATIDSPEASIPAGVLTGAVAQFRRFIPLTREQRDLIIAWRVWLRHKSIYTTPVDEDSVSKLDKRRTIKVTPIDDLMYDLQQKNILAKKPSGWVVVR